MATVGRWTGAETQALRQAMRLSLRDFAEYLGVAMRTVSKWEARGATIQLLPGSEELLDTTLGRVSEEVKARFYQLLDGRSGGEDSTADSAAFGKSRVIATEWEDMSPLNRRRLLETGLTVAAMTRLGMSGEAVPPSVVLPSSLFCGAAWAAPIVNAVFNPAEAIRQATPADGGASARSGELRRNVDRLIADELSSNYALLARTLPGLIGHTEAAALDVQARDGTVVRGLVSDTYTVAAWTLIKGDSPVAAWVAAQRAIHIAEQADDILRVAASTRCLAEVYMRAKNFHDATRTAFLAVVHLDTQPSNRTAAACLRGAALLSAAAAAARSGDSREAKAALKAAAICADELGEDRAEIGAVFGPTNVAIHQVAVALELGDARTALQHVDAVRLDRMPSELTERRARFMIDVARCHAAVGDDTAALDSLLRAEAIAPAELREHRLTHALLRELLAKERRSSELRALAGRCSQLN